MSEDLYNERKSERSTFIKPDKSGSSVFASSSSGESDSFRLQVRGPKIRITITGYLTEVVPTRVRIGKAHYFGLSDMGLLRDLASLLV